MGGASSPSPYTQSVQQIQGGWMANPTARAIGLPILKKLAAYNSGLMDTAIGAQNQDPTALAKFYGLPPNASTADIVSAIGQSHTSPQGVMQGMPPTQPPVKTAAQGGLMSLRGYAPGGAVKKLNPTQTAAVQKYNNLVTQGKTVPASLVTQLNKIETATGRNVSPYTDTGQAAVANTTLQNAINKAANSGNYPTNVVGTAPNQSIATKFPNTPAGKAAPPTTSQTDIGNANKLAGNDLATATDVKTYGVTPVLDANGKPTGQIAFNDPNFNKAVGTLDQLSGGTGLYGGALSGVSDIMSGLQAKAGYTPKDVSAQDASAQQGAAQQAQASLASRGDVRDIAAQQAQVDKYDAATMQAPQDIQAQGYDAAQAQLNQMSAPSSVSAATMLAAQMQKPEDVAAQQIGAAQMQTPDQVRAQQLEQYQMQGPASWTDAGTAQKYMNPYEQAVIDTSKREKSRDFAKQMNALSSKAMGQGAYGGAGAALERAEAGRTYQQQLQDLQNQGMSQAYQSGMGQFSAEQGLGLQAGSQNLQALLGVQNTGSSQALQAALANQQAGLTSGQANLGARQQSTLANQQALLQAAQANQQIGFGTNQANMQAQQQANQTNVQSGLQAALANQQAGLTAGQANLGAAQQTSLANQQALNAQRSQYVTQALQAAQNNYAGKLTAAQQNQVAQNAAAQFNSAAQNLSYNNYAAQNLAAQQANQGVDAQLAALNAQLGTQTANANAGLGTQASLTNAQLGTNVGIANAANALSASNANAGFGLQGNQQGIGALSNAGQLGMNLGGMGYQLAQGYGQAAGATTGLGQLYYDNLYAGNKNIINAPAGFLNQGLDAVSKGFGGTAGSGTTVGSPGSTK